MNKIKIFHWLLIVLLMIFTLSFFTGFYIYTVFDIGTSYSDFMFNMSISLCIIIGLFFLQRTLYSIIKNGFFNKVVNSNLKKGGLFFLIAGFGSAIFNIVMINRSSEDTSQFLFYNLGQDFLLIMIGFGLFVITEFVENGNLLKQENDLTI